MKQALKQADAALMCAGVRMQMGREKPLPVYYARGPRGWPGFCPEYAEKPFANKKQTALVHVGCAKGALRLIGQSQTRKHKRAKGYRAGKGAVIMQSTRFIGSRIVGASVKSAVL